MDPKSTNIPNRNYLTAALVGDELARGGVRHVVLCPGSRNTPLLLTLGREDRFRRWPLIDERSAGFFALGLAKASGRPAAVVCTSGTAAANLFPAVTEAFYSATPLLVLTADRPPELRDTGANQTIDQLKLFGSLVRWFVEVAPPDPSPAAVRYVRSVTARAIAVSSGPPAGPVHLNFPFREPLAPEIVPDDVPADLVASALSARDDVEPYTRVTRPAGVPAPETMAGLVETVRREPRGIILAGSLPNADPRLRAAVTAFACAAAYPILAEPLSGLRWGRHDRSLVVASYEAILRHRPFAESHRPGVALRLGAITTSRTAPDWLAESGCPQVVFDPEWTWPDPSRQASLILQVDAAATLEALAGQLEPRETSWLQDWLNAAKLAGEALARHRRGLAELFEGAVVAELADALPDGSTLYVASSMPIRDLEAFLSSDGREVRFLANRGVNGIDGVVSSALGFAAGSARPVFLLIGDVAFLHDIGGLFAARRHGLQAVIVVVNNNGGGIFSFLPQAAYPDGFEELLTTPHDLDLARAAALYGCGYELVTRPGELPGRVQAALAREGTQVIEARIASIPENVAEHRRAWEAVGKALATMPPQP